MEVRVLRGPAMLIEALDAVRIWHHDLPLDSYTRSGAGGIPPQATAEMVRKACGVLDLADPALHYYFQPWKLEVDPLRPACLASYMIYSWPDLTFGTIEQEAERICCHCRSALEEGVSVAAVSGLNLDLDPCPENRGAPVARIFEKTTLPEGFCRELATVFSRFDQHMARLTALLQPVANRLEQLLEPWVRSLEPVLEEWERELREKGPGFLLERCPNGELSRLYIRMRFLDERGSIYAVDSPEGEGHFHLHPRVTVTPREPGAADESLDVLLSSLRLIGDKTRMEMLQLMLEKPYYCNELADRLNVNSGIIFRNLNSLCNCRLITKRELGGKLCYMAEPERLRELLNGVSELLKL